MEPKSWADEVEEEEEAATLEVHSAHRALHFGVSRDTPQNRPLLLFRPVPSLDQSTLYAPNDAETRRALAPASPEHMRLRRRFTPALAPGGACAPTGPTSPGPPAQL